MGQKSNDPIAIVGMACRLPGGVNSPKELWEKLSVGFDAIEEVPSDRWNTSHYYDEEPGKPGCTNAHHGGYIKGVDLFDPGFFGISPREALCLDPQQRQLLEVSWEAIEDAGYSQETVSNSATGVYVGVSTFDYSFMQVTFRNFFPPDIYTNTGAALSMNANRISYCLNLHGPSFIVDTACSSGLLAVHLACESIRRGESKIALAGAVNLIINHNAYIGFSRLAMLSPSGKCQAFSEDADGFVRSEGAGVIALKPLADAHRDGDRIHALIIGSGSNQDGATPGITVPNKVSQISLLKETYGRFGVDPKSVSYIEAHGTGTPVGDPIEAQSLGEVLGAGRENPCWMGSVKTNIGHLEAASGLAGIIKAVMVIKNRKVVPNLHFENPNQEIDFEGLGLRVPTSSELLPGNQKIIAGVNSFGFGGTNVHTILQEYCESPKPRISTKGSETPENRLIPISARHPNAVLEYANFLIPFLDEEETSQASLDDICWSAIHRRNHHPVRHALVVNSKEELKKQLSELSLEKIGHRIPRANDAGEDRPLVFVFCGQGSQWWGMGQELYKKERVFRDKLKECHGLLAKQGGCDLLAEMLKGEEDSRIDDTYFAQPALFALQVSLAELWKSWGVAPDAVVGHSVGEVAAAYVSGSLSLEDAVKVIFHRAETMSHAPTTGSMMVVGLDKAQLLKILAEENSSLCIAALNTSTLITLSGSGNDVLALQERLQRDEIFHRILVVSHAFHSSDMDNVREPLLDALANLEPHDSSIPFYSTVQGKLIAGSELDAEYWWKNVRHKVRFADAISALSDIDVWSFLEIGPSPILSSSIRGSTGVSTLILPSLSKGNDEQQTILGSLGKFYEFGLPIKWPKMEKPERWLRLPKYPWQKQSYWRESPESKRSRFQASDHPLLGVPQDNGDYTWIGYISSKNRCLFEHVVQGKVLLPGCTFVEIAIAAASKFFNSQKIRIDECLLLKPCYISQDSTRELVTNINPVDMTFTISSRVLDNVDEMLAVHAKGSLKLLANLKSIHPDLASAKSLCGYEVPQSTIYDAFSEMGIDFGPSFRGIQKLWVGSNKNALSLIEIPEDNQFENIEEYHYHPAILDACLQTNIGAIISAGGREYDKRQPIYLPLEYVDLRMYSKATPQMWAYTRLVDLTHQLMVSDVFVYNNDGDLLLEIRGYTQKATGIDTNQNSNDLFYKERWQEELSTLPHKPSALETMNIGTCVDSLVFPEQDSSWQDRLDLDDAEAKLVTAFFQKYSSNLDSTQLPLVLQANHPALSALNLSKQERDPQHLWNSTLSRFPDALDELLDIAGNAENLLSGTTANTKNLHKSQFIHCMEERLNDYLLLDVITRITNHAENLKILIATPYPEKIPVELWQVNASISWHLLRLDEEGRSQNTRLQVDIPVYSISSVEDLEQQGLFPETFDLVILSGALSVADTKQKMLSALKFLLRNSGMVILRDYVDQHISNAFWPTNNIGTAEAWDDLLIEGGIEEVNHFPSMERQWGRKECLLIGRKPTTPPVQNTESERKGGTWLVFADQGGTATKFGDCLECTGDSCVTVVRGEHFEALDDGSYQINESSKEDMLELISTLKDKEIQACGIVYLWPLDCATENSESCGQGAYLNSCALSYLLQAQIETEVIIEGPLWLVVSGAARVLPSDQINLTAAAVWGFGRTIVNEMPFADCHLVDLGSRDTNELKQLVEHLHATACDRELAFRGDRIWANRISRINPELKGECWTKPDDRNFHLEVLRPGSLDSMVFQSYEEIALPPDQVEIEVHATAMNFSDVLKSIGMYPGIRTLKLPIGIECSGVVTAVGSDIASIKVGDQVLAIAPFCFAGVARTMEPFVVTKPSSLNYEAAAAVPIAFLTAYWALNQLARLQKGERILIHSATGGVGLAAIQLAQNLGTEIFATAGTVEKRKFLTLLGVEHVMDSRSIEFVDEIMEKTNGEGVDVVLNSLAGEALSKGLSVLREFGRFIEIGKKDIYANAKLGLSPFQKNLTFISADLDSMIRLHPSRIGNLFKQIVEDLERKKITPLAFTSIPIHQAELAFRHMGRARHLGKVVLKTSGQSVPVTEDSHKPICFRADASYLITGGFGGLGLILAEWLVKNGARSLWLVGRSGLHNPEDQARIDAMTAQNVKVNLYQADISKAGNVEKMINQIQEEGPPLAGVFHCAMVLDDGLIVNLGAPQIKRVFEPKVNGAWHLHAQTIDLELDHFVLFSSMSSLFGNPGQAAYSAANAFLDGLAQQRQSNNLPGLSINWGVFSSIGVAAADPKLLERFEGQGFLTIRPEEAMEALSRLMKLDLAQVSVMRMDWQKASALMNKSSGRFSELYQRSSSDGNGEGKLRERLLACSLEEQRELVLQVLKEKIALGLACQPEDLATDNPLSEFGMDSLTYVEFEIWVESELGLTLSIVDLMKGPTIGRLTDILIGQLNESEQKPENELGSPDELEQGFSQNGEAGSIVTDNTQTNSAMLKLQHWVCGPLDNNIFLVINEEQKTCVLFDPGIDIEPVYDYIDQKGLKVEKILLTHAHFDHIYGLEEAKRRYEAPVYMHPDDEPVRAGFKTISEDWGLSDVGNPPAVDHGLAHGEQLGLLGTSCEVRHTPGHTPGHVVFVFDGFTIVGDSLFYRSIGSYDSPDSDPKALLRSIEEQLYTLPNETTVYPSHGKFTSIGDELKFNPFVGEGKRFKMHGD